MEKFGGINSGKTVDTNTSTAEDSTLNTTEYLSPDNSYSELYSTASASSDMIDPNFDDTEPNLEEFDKNLPHTVTFLKTLDGARVYVVGTGHFSVESQNDVSRVMQAVKPHILVVELCADRASVMQMDEETIMKEARDFSLEKLKSIFNEAGVFQGIIYVLLLKLSANLTKNHGMAPGGEFRRALKEMEKLRRCLLFYGDRPLRITIKRALAKLSWWQSIFMFFTLLFSKTDLSVEELEKYKQKDIVEEMMAKLLEDYPDLSYVLINERDIFLTHSLQTAAEKQIHIEGKGRIPTRVVGIVGIGHCAGIARLWGTVADSAIPPLLIIPEPSRTDIYIKRTSSLKTLIMDSLEVDNYEHANESIFYTPRNIPGRGCDANLFDSQISASCACKYDVCADSHSCSCVRRTGKNYENKRLTDAKLFGAGAGGCIECNSRCSCAVSACENRLVQFGPAADLKIETVPGKGYGLVTATGMRKGRFVCEYAGEVIGKEEAIGRRRRGDGAANYIFTLNEYGTNGDVVVETIVDATCIANVGRYVNHSCDPNCVVIPVRVDSVVPRLAIFASKDLKPGEEITYCYDASSSDGGPTGDVNSAGPEGRKLCLCGSDRCSKYLPYNP